MKQNKDGFAPGAFLTIEQQNEMRVKKMQENRNVSAKRKAKTAVRAENTGAEAKVGVE